MEITQSLHRAAALDPGRVLTLEAGQTRTVAESRDRISRLAGGLRTLGIGTGDRVAILALNSSRYHETLYAAPWAGAVIVPVNVRWSLDEITFSLDEADVAALLVDSTFEALVEPLRARLPHLRRIIHLGTPIAGTTGYEQLIERSDPVGDSRRGGDDLLGIFYTGGTTGTPKGVMLSHDNLLVSALGALSTGYFISNGGRVLHAAPMFHLADLSVWVAGNIAGSTHCFVPAFTPRGTAAAIESFAVTDALLVPTMIQMLVDNPDAATHDVSSLQRVIYGASPISEALLVRARERFPVALFTQAYGGTESAPIVTMLSPTDHNDPTLARAAGRPAPHVELRILDPEGVDAPVGIVGEVVSRGGNTTRGYWNRPEETASAIVDGWFHSGDGGYVDERGYLFIVDRIKDMIVTGGENVYSVEVENAIASHPSVAMSAVIGLPDETWGEQVHAVVVLHERANATADDVRAWVKARIAGYKVPRSVEFAASLPISSAGKILKRELREAARAAGS